MFLEDIVDQSMATNKNNTAPNQREGRGSHLTWNEHQSQRESLRGSQTHLPGAGSTSAMGSGDGPSIPIQN
jgi:hypothetical protein